MLSTTGRRWAVMGDLLRAANDRMHVHQAPGPMETIGCACCRTLQWNPLSPVSLVCEGLSPVRPGTENTRQGKDLTSIRAFVPGVPGVLKLHPEGKGTPMAQLLGVLSAAVAGKFPAGAWGVVLCPGIGDACRDPGHSLRVARPFQDRA